MALTPVLPMMATLATTLPVGDRWSYEVKWDGYRCMLLSEGASARLISRNLKDVTSDYRHIAQAFAGKVRAGFTPRTRADVWDRIGKLEIAKCPFANLPNSTGKSHWGEGITAEDMKRLRWVKPRVIIEVAFTEFTAGGNLRHASFVALRDDKPAVTVSRSS
jgi:ATP-dependent DNA ligase